MKSASHIRALPGIATLLPFAFVTTSLPTAAKAEFTIELTATVEPLEGEAVMQAVELPGPSFGTGGEAEVTLGDASARTAATFDELAIKQYVAQLDEVNHDLTLLGDTRWVAKIGVDLHINAFHAEGRSGNFHTRLQRGEERYAAFAVAPNSASGFAPLDSAEVELTVQFFSDAYPLDFENNLFPPWGTGPYLDFRGEFHQTLSAINQGHALIVDLDWAGVAPGEEWGFVENYALINTGLGTIGGPTGGNLEEAFVVFDPVYGFAAGIPEPGTQLLMLTGMAFAPLFCRRPTPLLPGVNDRRSDPPCEVSSHSNDSHQRTLGA